MAVLLPQGKQAFTNNTGAPLAGGKLYTFAAGTSTPKATFSDAAGTVQNTNPIILDARGEAAVFWDGAYKVRLADALDNTIWTVDGVTTIDPFPAQLAAAGGGFYVNNSVPSRSDMAALPNPVAGRTVFLSEAGREGWFECLSGIPNQPDPAQAIYVPSSQGAFFYRRIRETDGVRAEWFGAKADGATDDSNAIMAAKSAGFGKVRLLATTYLIAPNVVKLNAIGDEIEGVGEFLKDGAGTRLLINSASGVGVQVGGDNYPGSINAMPAWARLKNVYVTRNQAPALTDDCVAILVQYGVHMRVENCGANESIIGFRNRGVVDTIISGCYAKRDTNVASGPDKWRGFSSDGTANIGASGGNASLNADVERNRVELTTPIADSIALEVFGAFTDQWWKVEASGPHSLGASITGTPGAETNTDFNLTGCRLDQTLVAAYKLTSVNENGSVEIDHCYGGPASGQLLVANGCGTITVTAGQWRCVNTTAAAVSVTSCAQFNLDGTSIDDGGGNNSAVVEITSCNTYRLRPSITNKSRATTGAAIHIIGANGQGRIEPSISGGHNTASFGYGILVEGSATTFTNFDVSEIDRTCLNGQKMLVVNGTTIAAEGRDATTGNIYRGPF